MKGRGRGGGGAPSDLLVCFPSRAHLALMPKPICSPSRPGDASRRLTMRTTTRGRSSPLARSNTTEIIEPTSPKVNCAGQIKAGARTRPVDWFGELQRTRTRMKTRTNWLEVIGIKKREAVQFINAIRGIRLRMSCFGSFHGSTSDDEDNSFEDEEEREGSSTPSGAALSKWFMVLEEKHCHDSRPFEESAPPPNALMLMRCRSAPARGWLEGDEAGEVTTGKMMKEGENEKEKERLVLMSYAPDFFKVSTDVAKETWVVGMVDTLARSRSWKI